MYYYNNYYIEYRPFIPLPPTVILSILRIICEITHIHTHTNIYIGGSKFYNIVIYSRALAVTNK